MHAIRGSWVGQTFALARCHDSGEKKARIRHSKEERKELVVSFIKKYQYSNKGEFPSLSVTKREVGGSFYTIREIVREIIQENRVLGPAKSTIAEQNADNFFDQHPLGSVAMEPDTDALSSNGPHIVITSSLDDPLQNTMEPEGLDFSQECRELENQKLNDGIIVNGSSYQFEKTQGFDGELENEPPVVRDLVIEDILEKEVVKSEAKLTQVAADVVIETFPIKPVTGKFSRDGDSGVPRDGDSGVPRVVAGTLEENESVNMNFEAVRNVVTLNTEDVEEKSSRFVDEKTHSNAKAEEADPSPENLNHSVRDISNVLQVDDVRTDLENNEVLPAEMNRTSAPNGSENLEAAVSGGSQGQPISEEVIATRKKSGIQNGSSSKKSSDPTLDRINLESWEATTDKSGGPQTNSLMSFVKACITAFVKFWSE